MLVMLARLVEEVLTSSFVNVQEDDKRTYAELEKNILRTFSIDI